ncbi:DNA polymerase III subunit beta [Govanella unica]|uniref:Beta sliding clamp n=1 Tax=Govanella unica TaxID=2975056 RepID=A0A9X3Z7Z3_9PROT|nr:DNA polymerase III subunit beta [Govania unica]MDA5194641.1 DNA polymerase III subunit beta [Govania unica]
MKLTIERAALLKALGHVQSVVERRNTIPILSNVRIEAEESGLKLTATDLDLAIVEEVAAVVSVPGAVTAPAHTLHDIVRKIPDGAEIELSFSTEDQRLHLKSGRSKFTLSCLPSSDFPEMSEGAMPHQFALTASELKELMDKTRFAVSTEETRYYLNGIYFHVTDAAPDAEGGASAGPVLRAVATDGHRLARVELPAPDGSRGMPGVIIPRKTVGELRKLIDELDGTIQVALSDTKVRFSFAGATLTSKLIDGTFPDYTRVIPVGNDKELTVDAKLFAEAVDRVSTISTDKTRSVKLALESGRVTLSVMSPDNGTATEEIAVSYEGSAMEIGFNARYLLDILSQITGGVVQVLLADAASPTLMRDAQDGEALYVLMPMRV